MTRSVSVLTPWFPNSPGDWPGSFIHDSCAAIVRRGWSADVTVARRTFPPFIRKAAGNVDCGDVDASAFPPRLDVSVSRYPALPRDHFINIWRPLRDSLIMTAFASRSGRHLPKLVHVHTEGLLTAGLQVAKAYGVPLILTVHGLDTRLLEPRNRGRKRALGELLKLIDKVILVGEPLVEFFSSIAGRSGNFVVVPNGAGQLDHRKGTLVFPDRRDVRMISVSNLNDEKGVKLTIEALEALHAKGLRNWSYKIIGDGPLAASLRSYIAFSDISGQVEFVGARPHREVFIHLSGADLFVLPSYREAFGIAYLEAMGCGLVAVGVHGQGPSMFIEHGVNGYLVEPNSTQALINLLGEVLTADRRVLRSVAMLGMRTAIEEYSWDVHARRLTAVYEDALREAKG
jgi:glycosyltransferase involved in cell wall biosynthesis